MREIRAWRLLQEGPTHDFQVLRVRDRKVTSPRDGSTHSRVFLEAPDWVHILATTETGELIFVRQFRFGIWDTTLEIPGGLIDTPEAPEDAARRELEEETGYRARAIRLLGVSHPNPALQNNRIYTFAAQGCEQVHGGRPDHGEEIAVELYPRTELPRLVKEGHISHALVLAAFFLETL